MNDFNFDEWMNLASSDPAEFERRRVEATQAVIAAAPANIQPDLQRLQSVCDRIRSSNEPIEATKRMLEMASSSLQMVSWHMSSKIIPALNELKGAVAQH